MRDDAPQKENAMKAASPAQADARAPHTEDHDSQKSLMDATLRAFYQHEQEDISPALWERAFSTLPTPSKETSPKAPAPLWKAWWTWSLFPLGAAAAFLLLLRPAPPHLLPPPTNPPSLQPPKRSQESGTNAKNDRTNAKSDTKNAKNDGMTAKSSLLALTLLHAKKSESYQHKSHTRPGAILHEGDIVQLAYESPSPLHLMLLSLNQRGEISLYAPFGKQKSLPIPKGQGFFPPEGSLTLDDYIGDELFIFLVSKQTFTLKEAERAILNTYKQAKHNLRAIQRIHGDWWSRCLLIHKQRSSP